MNLTNTFAGKTITIAENKHGKLLLNNYKLNFEGNLPAFRHLISEGLKDNMSRFYAKTVLTYLDLLK